MVKRKANKPIRPTAHKARRAAHAPARPVERPRHRFIISPKAAARLDAARLEHPRNGAPKTVAPTVSKPNGLAGKVTLPPAKSGPAVPGAPVAPVDLAETIKTLLHIAHEHGHVTYDDINDVLPEGMSPDDLDELYTKLRNLDIEIVDHAEVERPKPEEPEEVEDTRLEVLDDPVRMYMNQMGKVPLL